MHGAARTLALPLYDDRQRVSRSLETRRALLATHPDTSSVDAALPAPDRKAERFIPTLLRKWACGRRY